jgi:alginate O-acetyltransferase complex protein AlgI
LWGLFKKVVIADSLAQIANPIFADYANMSPMMLLVGSLAFTFQIYGDFSGYSDIALGSAKLLGFELLSNFKFPYFSRSIAEFWRRWHISLSSWFRDYLYIPLGGSRKGLPIALRNTMIIFLVSGFWHGASLNYIAWGGLHGCFFIVLMLRKNKNQFNQDVVAQNTSLPSLKEFFQMFGTFWLVALALNFFRIQNILDAIMYSKNLLAGLFKLNFNISHPDILNLTLLWIPVLLIIDWLNRHDERNFKVPQKVIFRWGLYLAMTFLIFMSSNKDQTFLYFQF